MSTGAEYTSGVERFFANDPAPSPRRLRKHALADQVRALVTDVLGLDVEAADDESLERVAGLLASARADLTELPRLARRSYGDSGADSNLLERSPLSGRCNALAAPLRLWHEGETTFAEATFHDGYEGPPGSVHGGYVIAAFDEVLGVAQSASGMAGFTGTLSVRLARPTPLRTRIDYAAGVTSHEGRKIEAWGRSTLDGELLAEATAVFVTPRTAYFPTSTG